MTRKCDTLIHSPGYGERMYDALAIADYSSKQNSGRGRAVSLQLSLLVQADMGMGKPHCLLAIYASAVER